MHAGFHRDGLPIHFEAARVEPGPQVVVPRDLADILRLQFRPGRAQQTQAAKIDRMRVLEHPAVEFAALGRLDHGTLDSAPFHRAGRRNVRGCDSQAAEARSAMPNATRCCRRKSASRWHPH